MEYLFIESVVFEASIDRVIKTNHSVIVTVETLTQYIYTCCYAVHVTMTYYYVVTLA